MQLVKHDVSNTVHVHVMCMCMRMCMHMCRHMRMYIQVHVHDSFDTVWLCTCCCVPVRRILPAESSARPCQRHRVGGVMCDAARDGSAKWNAHSKGTAHAQRARKHSARTHARTYARLKRARSTHLFHVLACSASQVFRPDERPICVAGRQQRQLEHGSSVREHRPTASVS